MRCRICFLSYGKNLFLVRMGDLLRSIAEHLGGISTNRMTY